MPTDPLLAVDLEGILDRTGDVWRSLSGQRVFITGGTGFVGCWLLESLVHARERLKIDLSATVLTRSRAAFATKAPHLVSDPAITLVEGDVRAFRFPDGHFSHLIHAATDSTAAPASPLTLFDTIVSGTRRVLDFAQQCDGRRFLLTSSGAVYGSQPTDVARLSEDYRGAPSAVEPGNAYGEGKRAAEMLCATVAHEAKVEPVIARCFAFVGPHLPLDAHFAIGNFIRDRLRGDPIRVRGDGTTCRSYLYAADLAAWLWTLLVRGTPARPYNVGSPDGISIAELASLVAAAGTPAVRVVVEGAPLPGGRHRYVPDVSRALMELGVCQAVSLEDGIRRTLDWHRQRGRAAPVGGGPRER